jgi:hypothetical protein
MAATYRCWDQRTWDQVIDSRKVPSNPGSASVDRSGSGVCRQEIRLLLGWAGGIVLSHQSGRQILVGFPRTRIHPHYRLESLWGA